MAKYHNIQIQIGWRHCLLPHSLFAKFGFLGFGCHPIHSIVYSLIFVKRLGSLFREISSGGAEGARTLNLSGDNRLLSQLSYRPTIVIITRMDS